MPLLQKMNVCQELCHPSVGRQLHDIVTGSKTKSKKRRHLFVHGAGVTDTMPSNTNFQYSSGKIIREQSTTDCVLIHVCSRAILKELETKVVGPEVITLLNQYWKRSLLNGSSRYAQLLSKIRCLALVEVTKRRTLGKGSGASMTEIIQQAAEDLHPTRPF